MWHFRINNTRPKCSFSDLWSLYFFHHLEKILSKLQTLFISWPSLLNLSNRRGSDDCGLSVMKDEDQTWNGSDQMPESTNLLGTHFKLAHSKPIHIPSHALLYHRSWKAKTFLPRFPCSEKRSCKMWWIRHKLKSAGSISSASSFSLTRMWTWYWRCISHPQDYGTGRGKAQTLDGILRCCTNLDLLKPRLLLTEVKKSLPCVIPHSLSFMVLVPNIILTYISVCESKVHSRMANTC